MLQAEVTLISSTDTLILDALDGWGITKINLGDSKVRANTQDAPDADGTLDFTEYVGARTFTLGFELVPVTYTLFDMVVRLKAFQSLRRPIRAEFRLEEGAPLLKADLRKTSWNDEMASIGLDTIVAQWEVPKGIYESAEAVVTNILPAGSGVELGRSYDRSGDRTYPASPVLGSGSVVNLGNFNAYPLLRIYGACTDPVIYNDTQGLALAFTGLTINAGEFLEIDTRYKTIRYQGLATDSRYDKLSFPTSRWWTLEAQTTNALRFVPATAGATSVLEVTHNHAYDL